MIYILPGLNPLKQQPSQRGEEGGAGGRACDIKINTETSIPWQRRRFAKEKKNSLSATSFSDAEGAWRWGTVGKHHPLARRLIGPAARTARSEGEQGVLLLR